MDKQEFLQEVQEELDNIKAKATKKEISNLTYKALMHDSPSSCIYGLMTGGCKTDRAIELAPKDYYRVQLDEVEKDVWTILNGENFYSFEEQDFNKSSHIGYGDFTALEKYLFMVNPLKHKQIIKYLKGTLKTINLTLD